MADFDKRIQELHLTLPPAPKPVAVYKPAVKVGNLLFVSGHGPLKPDKSLILGSDDRWVGKIALDVDMPTTQAYAYYADRMPTFGWEPITAVQGKTSTLTFLRGDRAATVEIAGSGFKGSEVGITVSPRQVPAKK